MMSNPDGRGGGSSPRMRGALVRTPSQFVRVRIIPADAGSTFERLKARH